MAIRIFVAMAEPAIATFGLTRHYGATVGIADLDLVVERGEVFGFLGPNGAGKTTTIRLLLDLIRPTHGRALVLGQPTSDPAIRARIGYLPGELVLDGGMSGADHLRFLDALLPGSPNHADRRAMLCHRLGLSARDLRRKIREYSRGMKQKLGLVSAFQHAPELLVLDEPTEGLDPLVREVIFDLMAEAKAGGATVFHSSHVLSEVDRTCDRVAVLRRGRLVGLMRVEEVRHAAVRRMVVEFADEVPLDALALPGVEIVERAGQHVILRVTGTPQSLLELIAQHSVRYMAFPESSLEEAFTSFYQGP